MAHVNKLVSLLTRKNQTTIPRIIREQKGLAPGDKIAWFLNSDGTINLEKVVDDREIEKFIGIIKTTQETDDIMEQLRGTRQLITAVDTNLLVDILINGPRQALSRQLLKEAAIAGVPHYRPCSLR